MIKIISMILGLLSAILICIIFLIPLFLGAKIDADALVGIISLIILGASWFFSSIIFMENADTVAKVFARAFLIWGAEWLVIMFIFILTSFINLMLVQDTESKTAIGLIELFALVVSLLSQIGFCVLMSFSCMIGYAISVFLPKELA